MTTEAIDTEPADLDDPDLEHLMAVYDATIEDLLQRRENLRRWLRHPAGRGNEDLIGELACVEQELAGLGVEE